VKELVNTFYNNHLLFFIIDFFSIFSFLYSKVELTSFFSFKQNDLWCVWNLGLSPSSLTLELLYESQVCRIVVSF
jgi:hypothetical protein